MDVVSGCPLRVASRLSPSARGGFLFTFVCKATYRLLPGESELNVEQEEPNEEDNYWDDDPKKSLYSPGDLIPFKARADVVLVGHAFAPGQAPARSILTHLVVGEIDKSIEAFCDRSFGQDGQLREGPKVTRVPLRYERASGGPGTWNPVGMRTDVMDAYGSIALPNLQPAGTHVQGRGDFIRTVGYGPIGPTWPLRQEKLGRLAGVWDSSNWDAAPLPEGLDRSFFNVAPPDQQVGELRANERIVLENLHPEHPRLVTSLPGQRPRAVLERHGAREEIALIADTLWIDTALSICTLVWRGQVAMSHRQEAGRIVVTLASAGAQAGWTPALPASVGAAPIAQEDPDGGVTVAADDPGIEVTMTFGGARRPVMPFAKEPSPPAPAGGYEVPRSAPASPPAHGRGSEPEELSAPTVKLRASDVLARAVLPFRSKSTAPLPVPPPPPPPESHAPPPAPPPPVVPAPRPLSELLLDVPADPRLNERATSEAPTTPMPAPAPPPELPPEPPMIGPLAKPPLEIASNGAPFQQEGGAPAAAAPFAAPRAPASKEIPVETCAAIAAATARKREDTPKILEEHGITAPDWARVERYWTEAIRKETDRGRTGLLKAYDAAYVAELERLRGPITVDEYARLVVAAERGSAPPALAELGLPRGSLLRIERVWLDRVADDAALAADIRKAILAARLA